MEQIIKSFLTEYIVHKGGEGGISICQLVKKESKL